jgi:pyruvate dehydrogenase E1 component alpha subunit
MVLIRRFEEGVAEAYADGFIGGFMHLYIGQEAVATGAITALNHDDYAIGTYRVHAHALVRGSSARSLMAELYGRATGVCKGKGVDHFFDAHATSWAATGSWAAISRSASAPRSRCRCRTATRW